jgi:parvulin-like peptidyl-prolyl isomerase
MYRTCSLRAQSIVAVGVLLALFLADRAVAADDAPATDPVVATVGGTEIKRSDVEPLLDLLEPAQRKSVLASPNALTELVRRQAQQIAVIREAESRHWPDDPRAKLQLRQAQDSALASGYLASISEPPADYPPESEIRAAFDRNKNQLLRPGQYQLQQLTVARPEKADKATLERLERFVNELQKRARGKAADFAKLALPAKGNEFAVTYRDLGFVPADQLVPELRQALQGMNIGDVLPVLSLPNEFDVIRLRDLKPPTPIRYEEAHDEIAAALRQRKSSELRQAALRRILDTMPVAIDQIAIGRMAAAK